MAAETAAPQRRVLLLLTAVMALSAAVVGGLAASLILRAPPGVRSDGPLAASATTILADAAPQPDRGAMAALDAALGRSVVPRPGAAVQAAAARPILPIAVPEAAPIGSTPAVAAAPPLAAPPIAAGYTLDLGYFLVPQQAVAFATVLQERGVEVQLQALPDPSGRVWTHVRTPPFAGSAQALADAARIEREFGVPVSLVAPPSPPANASGTRP